MLDNYPVGNKQIACYSNKPLSDPFIISMIIGIHGNSRNAEGLFKDLCGAIPPDKAATTLIIVPWFKTVDDNPSSDDIFWTDEGWKRGDYSASGSKFSSFELIDLLTNEIMQARAKSIVIVGHSAGGQFVQRYAVGRKLQTTSSITYLVANAGSYMYLDNKRPVLLPTKCSYNKYKYGVEMTTTSHYMYIKDLKLKIAEFLDRKITYLLGVLDVTNEDLDTSCAANYQGPNRLIRGAYFYESLKRLGFLHNQQLVFVPGVGHSADQMYKSPEMRLAIKNSIT